MKKDFLDNLSLELKENVLDYPRKKLNPYIFDSYEKLLPEVKKEITTRFNNWKNKTWPDIKIKNWYLLGSITTYQYNSTSDLDVNIMIEEVPKEKLSDMTKLLPNGNTYRKHPINYYISFSTDNIDKSLTLYDIESDKWIKKPSASNNAIPNKYSMEIAKFFMDAIDLRLGELERDKKELSTLQDVIDSGDLNSVEEEDIIKSIDKTKLEIKADIDSIRLAHYIVKGFRKEGFIDSDNKFQFSIYVATDSDYNKSMNNLIYKELEKFGYFNKMDKAENEI